MTSVRLSWPNPLLSPNARAHWRPVAAAKKVARSEAFFATLEALRGRKLHKPLAVKVTFFPPDQRARDTDNMLACCKAALDGVADATGVDDSKWTLTISRGEPIPGGAVLLTITEAS